MRDKQNDGSKNQLKLSTDSTLDLLEKQIINDQKDLMKQRSGMIAANANIQSAASQEKLLVRPAVSSQKLHEQTNLSIVKSQILNQINKSPRETPNIA